jgi:hypothetical protein
MAGLAAAIMNSALFYAFKNLGAINDTVQIMPGEPLGVHNAIISSIISSLIASIVYFVIAIFARDAFRIFQRIAWIMLMHIVVAAAVIYIMKKHIPFLR